MPIRTQNKNREIAQGVVIKSANNLPVSSVLRIEGTNKLIQDNTNSIVSYSSPTVTLPTSTPLTNIRQIKSKYTGTLILITANNEHYFIDRSSIDYDNKTLNIYEDAELVTAPTGINLSSGWEIAEAKLVNYLSVSSQAHIDEVNFRGFDVEFTLDAKTDSVALKDKEGHELDINSDGSIDVNMQVDADDGDTIAIARHAQPFEQSNEFNLSAGGLSTSAYTQVYTFTSASDDLRIKTVKSSTSTLGTWKVKVDGQIKEVFRTSNNTRNLNIDFYNEIDLLDGQVLSLEFRPDRLRLNNYEFFVRLEGYEDVN